MAKTYNVGININPTGFGDAISQSNKLSQNLGGLSKTSKTAASMMLNLGTVVGTGLGFKELNKTLVDYNKQLFDISRQTRVWGQSFQQLRVGMENLAASTTLSRKDAATFFKTMQDGVKGARRVLPGE